jgi:Domain of unknown function (DUF397)
MNNLSNARWLKSSYSTGASGNCVEVATMRTEVGVRDSKDRSGPALLFGAVSWSAFVVGVRSGQFDR